jgi:hypothetical protein
MTREGGRSMKDYGYQFVMEGLRNLIGDLWEKYPEVSAPLPERIEVQNARIKNSDAMQAFYHASMLMEILMALREKSAPPESETAAQ